MMAADWDADFPLASRDKNWELLRYSWNEETGEATFAYRHRYTDAIVEDVRSQQKYKLSAESKRIARGVR